ncbi:MAG: MotA/TolQ/ExbB proton channel family protein [Deltaproteobacteria bacterium]|nr:MotA/TolQ/ExbB proton channel family protein [Deltaproteobacteria bacterium]
MQYISDFFVSGGAWMWPILVMSIIALAVMVDRFIFLYLRHNVNAVAFMEDIKRHVQAGHLENAIKSCNAVKDSALARVVKEGLTHANRSPGEIQNAIEEATLEVAPEITKRGTLLQNIANIATLLGLLGTIVGLIDAFSALATITDPEQQTKMLTNGISVAMNTTAFGLIVAIPCLLAHVMLSAVTKKIIDEIEHYSVKIENLLVTRLQGK